MKRLFLLMILLLLANFTLEVKSAVMRDIEGGEPIEVRAGYVPPKVEEVEEYAYEGNNDSGTTEEFKGSEEESFDQESTAQLKEGFQKLTEVKQANQVATQEVAIQEENTLEDKRPEIRMVPVEEPEIKKEQETLSLREVRETFYPDQRGDFFFSASFGFANTRYDKLDSGLEKGSLRTEVAVFRQLSAQNSVGLSLSFLHPTASNLVVENTTVSVLKPFFAHSSFLTENLYLVGSIGLGMLDHNIRASVFENETYIAFKKIKSGFAVGLIPEFSARYYVERGLYVDVAIEYAYYFGEGNRYLGDFAIKPRLSISF